MNSNTTRMFAGIAVIVVAIVLLIVLKHDSSGDVTSTNASGRVPTIVIKDGKPVGGIRDLTYNKGEQIHFKVDSDVSDEVHVHGYDIIKDVRAGGSVNFDFPASLEGVFEAELEGRGEQIIELTVNP